MAHGSRLMAYGSRLVAQGSWLMAKKIQRWVLWAPEPWGRSPEPWAMNHWPLIIDWLLYFGFQILKKFKLPRWNTSFPFSEILRLPKEYFPKMIWDSLELVWAILQNIREPKSWIMAGDISNIQKTKTNLISRNKIMQQTLNVRFIEPLYRAFQGHLRRRWLHEPWATSLEAWAIRVEPWAMNH